MKGNANHAAQCAALFAPCKFELFWNPAVRRPAATITTALALALLACCGALFAQAPAVADPRVIINRLDANYRQPCRVGNFVAHADSER
jgi:hypothetical protein